jgi:DNA-directed RNA polymerase subunit M/transcription elongation factor TFIIS
MIVNMDLISKVKILKMLCHYLSNKDNIKLFYDCLIQKADGVDFAFECAGYFEELHKKHEKMKKAPKESEEESKEESEEESEEESKEEVDVSEIFKKLRDDVLIWKDLSFDKMLKIEQEEDDFLETPLEVAKGAIKCKCGSERVFSFSKQTRGGDESTTVFALCSACRSRWVL